MARAGQVEEKVVEQPETAPVATLEAQVAGLAEALKGMQDVMSMLTQKVLNPEPKNPRVFTPGAVPFGIPDLPEGTAHYVSDERHLTVMKLDMTSLDRGEKPHQNPLHEYIQFSNGNLITDEEDVIRQLDWMIAGGPRVPKIQARRLR